MDDVLFPLGRGSVRNKRLQGASNGKEEESLEAQLGKG